MHQKHLRILATEVFKNLTVNPEFVKPDFTTKGQTYCLRNGIVSKISSACTTRFNAIQACLLWNKLLLSVKQFQSLIEFKSKTKTLRKIDCYVNFFLHLSIYSTLNKDFTIVIDPQRTYYQMLAPNWWSILNSIASNFELHFHQVSSPTALHKK